MKIILFVSLLAAFDLSAQGPSADFISPASGSSSAQQLVHFAAQVSSTHGAGFIKWVNISFDAGPGSLPGCQIILQDNQFSLIGDSGISYAGSAFVGGPSSVSNSKCALDSAHSSVTLSGNTLKIDLAISFLGSPASYQARLLVGDRDGNTTINADSNGFKLAGSWAVLAPNTNPMPVSATGSSPVCPGPGNGSFIGCYYNNIDLTGSPVLVRTDKQLNFNWGTGSPDPSVSALDFSARWQGTFNFDQGTYTFNATTSDGMRVYIDGNPVMYRWRDQPPNTYRFSEDMSQGNHLITVEYYDHTGPATAILFWEKH